MLTRVAVFLIAAALLALIAVALARFPAHLSDTLWPAHAKAHLVSQIAALAGLSVIGLLLLFGPFRARQRWAWYGLLACGMFAFGGYWIAAAVAEPPYPWRSGHTTFALLSTAYFLGLALGWRHCFRPGR